MSYEERLARSYREHADELRAIAESTLSKRNRASFIKAAAQYDSLANTISTLHRSRANILKARTRSRFAFFARAS